MAAVINTNVGAFPGLPGGTSSAVDLTAPQQIKATPGLLLRISCIVAGSLTLLDSTTSSGYAIFETTTMTAGQVVNMGGFPFFGGLYASGVSGSFALAFT
ncbi:MAG: hypothetical protein WBE92_00055 [Steroidobacteraceae bacterium]